MCLHIVGYFRITGVHVTMIGSGVVNVLAEVDILRRNSGVTAFRSVLQIDYTFVEVLGYRDIRISFIFNLNIGVGSCSFLRSI